MNISAVLLRYSRQTSGQNQNLSEFKATRDGGGMPENVPNFREKSSYLTAEQNTKNDITKIKLFEFLVKKFKHLKLLTF